MRTIAGTTRSAHRTREDGWRSSRALRTVITFQSGFTANLGTIARAGRQEGRHLFGPSSTTPRSSTAAGSRAHASCRTSTATRPALEAAIEENAGTYRRALLVTDGVFSMDGDIAPLPALYEVANEVRAHVHGGRRPRRGRAGHGRPRHRGPLRHARQGGYRGRHAVEGLRRGRRPGGRQQDDRRTGCASAAGRSCSPRP